MLPGYIKEEGICRNIRTHSKGASLGEATEGSAHLLVTECFQQETLSEVCFCWLANLIGIHSSTGYVSLGKTSKTVEKWPWPKENVTHPEKYDFSGWVTFSLGQGHFLESGF